MLPKILNMMESKSVPIDSQLSTIWQQKKSKNREILKSIVKTVMLYWRQGFALHSNRNAWKHLKEEHHINRGNFVALLQFKVDSGDAE